MLYKENKYISNVCKIYTYNGDLPYYKGKRYIQLSTNIDLSKYYVYLYNYYHNFLEKRNIKIMLINRKTRETSYINVTLPKFNSNKYKITQLFVTGNMLEFYLNSKV